LLSSLDLIWREMMESMIGQIELTNAEQEFVSKIVFDHETYVRLEREQAIENGELAAVLMQCLMDRQANRYAC
jgi:hypothetical protein